MAPGSDRNRSELDQVEMAAITLISTCLDDPSAAGQAARGGTQNTAPVRFRNRTRSHRATAAAKAHPSDRPPSPSLPGPRSMCSRPGSGAPRRCRFKQPVPDLRVRRLSPSRFINADTDEPAEQGARSSMILSNFSEAIDDQPIGEQSAEKFSVQRSNSIVHDNRIVRNG